jgi:DNA-binding winged helix-turn-helix (wHTH) protein
MSAGALVEPAAPPCPPLRHHTPGVRARLLRRLLEARGAVVSQDALLDAMYPGSAEEPEWAASVLRVEIHKLRARLGRSAIVAHYAKGYAISPDVIEHAKARFCPYRGLA